MRKLAFLLALLAPGPALALSCLAPTVERSFQQVNDAPETYVAVHGRLTLHKNDMPSDGMIDNSPPQMTMVPARLEGLSMTRAGFEVPFEQDVTLEVACFGPWCGSIENGADVLAFVRRDADEYALNINPCGGHVFTPAKPAQLRQVVQCFNGGDCAAD